MLISGRHRSPLLRESQDLPKDFYSFQSAAQPGGALFCASPFKVIYQLYPTANVFCAIDISVCKTAISSLFHMLYTTIYRQFRNKLQKHCNFRGSATLSRPVSMQSIQLCRLHSFRSKFIHFGNAVKSSQITRAIFVRFLSVSLQFTSFFFPFLLLSYLYTTSLVQ